MSAQEEAISASVEIIKNWLEEEQGHYLAIEDQVVHWNHDTDKVFQSTWVNLKLKDCVRMIKATRFPRGLMKYCTEDLFLSAAQESERVFERGVSVNGACPAHYFNYRVSTVNDPLVVVVVKLLEYTERNRWNILWKDVAAILDLAWVELDIVPPTRRGRNALIREACRHTKYEARQHTKRYNYDKGKYNCVRLPFVVGFEKVFTERDFLMLAKLSVKGSLIKKKKGLIVSDAEIANNPIVDAARFKR